MSCVIALDVGGASVKSAVVESASHSVNGFRIDPIDSYGETEAILGALTDVVRTQIEPIEHAALSGVGIGFPGPFDYANGVCRMLGISQVAGARGKFDAIYGLDLRVALRTRCAALRPRLNRPALPIVFCNDAQAAILGEARYGAGCTRCRLIGVTLGTGFGSVFLVDGVPVTTGPGVPPNGWLYPMPVAGRQADDVFSTRGLLGRLHSTGANFDNAEQAAVAARGGDETARQVFREFGADLGHFLHPCVLDFGAEAVLILGGIARALDLFGDGLARELPVPALPGALGPHAALLGAADGLF